MVTFSDFDFRPAGVRETMSAAVAAVAATPLPVALIHYGQLGVGAPEDLGCPDGVACSLCRA